MTNNPFAEAFASDPLLVDPMRVAHVSAALNALTTSEEGQRLLAVRAGADDEDFWGRDSSNGHPYRPYSVKNGTLSIPVQGVLLNQFSYQFGRWATGYQYIEKALARGLTDPNVQRIALVCNSPGGEVAGCFELADKIFEGRQEKPIRAFAADHAYSAAYALASSASEIVVSRSGGTGSVGVVTMHVNYGEALAQMGIEVTFIFAGKHKVDGNAYEKLPDSVKGRIQDRIDRIYGVFTSTVARNRGVEEEAVRGTEALTFDAQDSVAKGFADRVGALEEEMVAFSNETTTDQEGEQMSFTQEQMDAAVATAREEGMAAGRAEGVKAEQDRRAAILGADAAKSRPKAAAAFVARGLDAETAIALLDDMPEEKAEAPKAQTPQGGPTGGTPFDKHMAESGNPEVGADGGAGGEQLSEDEKATAAIVGAARAYKGKPRAA